MANDGRWKFQQTVINELVQETVHILNLEMAGKLEDQAIEAIEFFPGRVNRDQWAKQAKELAKNKK